MAAAQAFRDPPLIGWQRWVVRKQPTSGMHYGLWLTGALVLVAVLLLIVLLIDAFA